MIMERLLKVFQKVWEDGEVVSAWQDAVVFPSQRKRLKANVTTGER